MTFICCCLDTGQFDACSLSVVLLWAGDGSDFDNLELVDTVGQQAGEAVDKSGFSEAKLLIEQAGNKVLGWDSTKKGNRRGGAAALGSIPLDAATVSAAAPCSSP